ncbi:hypothetical protein DYB37_006397 [Aphanomyces astaci]|uniref:Uncharacterized protein n=1 Tax=Aphanomyces astaci TaxID=112090 RepID=A0A418EHV5_APHAT|nr:hypothetical protein DYB37_006397 [Aphanomyces astaci]
MAHGANEQAVMSLLSMLLLQPHEKTTIMLAEELAKLPRGDYMWMNVLLLHVYQLLMQSTAAADTRPSTVERLVVVLEKALVISNIQAIQESHTQCFKLLQWYTSNVRYQVVLLLTTSVVSVLLFTAQKDPNRTCRVHALRTLTATITSIDDADVLTQVFPGLMSALFVIVQGDYKLGSRLPTQAIRCLTTSMKLVVADSRCSSLVTSPVYSLAFLDPNSSTPSTLSPTTIAPSSFADQSNAFLPRSPTWLRGTQTNLHTLITYVCSHQVHHSNAAIRQALASFCAEVLEHCRLTLPSAFVPCYETLLALSQDPVAAVHAVAWSGLATIHANLSPSEQVLVHTNASAQCMAHLDALMLKCAAASLDLEREAVTTLQVCLGYVTSSQAKWVVDVRRVLKAWTRILAVDALDAQVLAYTSHNTKCKVAYYRKRFEHFRSDEAVAVALRVVRSFAATDDGHLLAYVDAIVAHVNDYPEDSLEWLIVLNQLVLGAAQVVDDDVPSPGMAQIEGLTVHVGAYLVDVVLQLPLWSSSYDESLSVVLEIVGSIAQALGVAFRPLLMHVLYPLVEQLGRPSPVVQQAALATLERIAFFCDSQSVSALLQANMDYVVDMLVSRLTQLDEYPHTPFVVQGLLRHGGSSVTSPPLPLLEEAVAGVIRSVDFHVATPQHALGLLRVMKVVVSNEQKQKPPAVETQDKPTTSSASGPRVTTFIQDMNALFQLPPPSDDHTAFHPTGETAQSSISDNGSSVHGAMPIEHDEHQDDAADTPPKGMAKLVEDIVLRSTYFTAAPDTATACLAWQVLTDALAAVHPQHLRPLVHRTWPQLAHRVGDSSHKPKHLAAVQCISAVAGLCGDFISDKFVESVWPTFQTHLAQHAVPAQSTAVVLDNVVTSSTTTTSSTSSLQRPTALTDQIHLHMLVCLERLCRATDAVAFLVPDMATAAQSFLASSAPPPLQEQAVALFQALIRLNADLIFPRVAYMASLPLPPPPSVHFPAYAPDALDRIPDRVPRPALFARNARILVQQLLRPPATD